MMYSIDTDQFYQSKMFDSKGKFYHKPGYRFKLFPFITRPNSAPVLELRQLIGLFLCQIEGKKNEGFTVTELVDKLKEETEIDPGYDELFYETVKQLFFYPDQTIRPLNLQFLEKIPCKEKSEQKVAEYLVDVLGDKEKLKENLQLANENSFKKSNVFERIVIKKISSKPNPLEKEIPYFRIVNSLQKFFEEDFEYVLESPQRSREYLVELLEFYFFSYTSQTCMQLDRFLDGDREQNIPLYFCLEWEKTSQSRQCFTEGWQRLQRSIEKIFVHAVVLELLNQTEPDSEPVDYICIAELLRESPEHDEVMASQIDEITNCYRNSITDCPVMNELSKKTSEQGKTADAIRYLFESVKIQFENTVRNRAYSSYKAKFESYCHKYLKSRGRSGLMLNLSEETLIFLTKMCVKNREQMRLKDVFEGLEDRGVFLDNISKEQVTNYYEKLNLIEKKSDSGDSKYVKRIL